MHCACSILVNKFHVLQYYVCTYWFDCSILLITGGTELEVQPYFIAEGVAGLWYNEVVDESLMPYRTIRFYHSGSPVYNNASGYSACDCSAVREGVEAQGCCIDESVALYQ